MVLKNDRKNVRFHRMERIMEEALSIFQNVVKAEKRNVRYQKNCPLKEHKKPESMSNKEQGMD